MSPQYLIVHHEGDLPKLKEGCSVPKEAGAAGLPPKRRVAVCGVPNEVRGRSP